MRAPTLMLVLVATAMVVQAADLSHEIVYRMADGRQYAISNPQAAGSNPLPLILYYHGINTPCTRVTGDILDAAAAQNFPALIGSVCGNNGAWDTNGRSDIDYTHRVIADVASKYSIDQKKVFLTGWSMGGMMCSRIACQDGGIAAGIAMVDCAFNCDNFAVKTNLMGVEAIYDSVCVNWISPAYASWASAYGCPSAGSGDTRRQVCSGKFMDLDRLPAGHNYIDVPNQVAFFKRIAGVSAPCDSNPCASGQICTNNGNTYSCGVNVAIGKTASMTGVGNWCSGSGAPCLASYAVDGDYSQNPSTGKCAHSAANTGNQYWRVDLGAATSLSSVVLYLRTDCCSERANGLKVFLSNSATAWDAAAVQIGVISQQMPSQVYTFAVPANTAAYQYLEVRAVDQWLALCEVAAVVSPNACASAPCMNGGSCVRTTTGPGYTCTCAAGFSGANCDTCAVGFTQYINSDAPNNDIRTQWGVTSYADCAAQCTATAGCVMFSFNEGLKGCFLKRALGAATAANGFVAGVCTALLTAPAPCASAPCENGGTCNNILVGGFVCTCPPFFGGDKCQTPLSIAQAQPTTMSGVGTWCNGNSACDASYAIDGKYGQSLANGFCAHSGACTGNQYWRVDLGAVYTLSQVSLYLRTDCCTTRAVGYTVYASNSTAALDANAMAIGTIAAQTSNQVYTFTTPAAGQFVEVRAVDQCLTICEVGVLGVVA